MNEGDCRIATARWDELVLANDEDSIHDVLVVAMKDVVSVKSVEVLRRLARSCLAGQLVLVIGQVTQLVLDGAHDQCNELGVVCASVNFGDWAERIRCLAGEISNNASLALSKWDSVTIGFGCAEVVSAIKDGARLIVARDTTVATGVLGALVAKFGWSHDDFEKLGQGVAAGVILENSLYYPSSMWKDSYAHSQWMSRAVVSARCRKDGSVFFSSRYLTTTMVKELLFCGAPDPSQVSFPDATIDITGADVEVVSSGGIQLSHVKGVAPVKCLEVKVAQFFGYQLQASLCVIGHDASEKAALIGRSCLRRANAALATSDLGLIEEYSIQVIGNGKECTLVIVFSHPDSRALDVARSVIFMLQTDTVLGVSLNFVTVNPLLSRSWMLAQYDIVDQKTTILKKLIAPVAPQAIADFGRTVTFTSQILVPLCELACGSSRRICGDSVHVVLIAKNASVFSVLEARVTTEVAQQYLFGHGHTHEHGLRHFHLSSFEHGHGTKSRRQCAKAASFRTVLPKQLLISFFLADVAYEDLFGHETSFAQHLLTLRVAVPSEWFCPADSKL